MLMQNFHLVNFPTASVLVQLLLSVSITVLVLFTFGILFLDHDLYNQFKIIVSPYKISFFTSQRKQLNECLAGKN